MLSIYEGNGFNSANVFNVIYASRIANDIYNNPHPMSANEIQNSHISLGVGLAGIPLTTYLAYLLNKDSKKKS